MKAQINLSVVVPWLLSLATAAIGIWQFTQQQEQKNREPFLQKQLELCFEATEAAAVLATEDDPVVWEKARKTFWRLYWGKLSIVEDRKVESAMYELGKLVPKEPLDGPKPPLQSLEQPSLRLAHATRNLILASWKIDLPPLQGR